MRTPIKTVGSHSVTVRLHPEVSATLDVEIIRRLSRRGGTAAVPDAAGPPGGMLAGGPLLAVNGVARQPPGQRGVEFGDHGPDLGQPGGQSAILALESSPALAAAATSSMAMPISAKRSSTVEHMCETIGQAGP